jgi:hypothetical protein
MSGAKRRVAVETDDHLEHFEATSFGMLDGHLFVHDGDAAVAVFAPGAWLAAWDEDATPARVASAA